MPRTQQELTRHLAAQIYFLHRSCDDYDKGLEIEAMRLAHSLRILLHHTSHSQSLLEQVGCRESLQMYESTPGIPPEGNENGTWALSVIVGARYFPKLDDESQFVHQRNFVQFNDWWRRPVLQSSEGHTFTRESLVLVVANQDGGSHVDDRLNDGYRLLTSGEGFGHRYITSDPNFIQPSPAPSAIRQIAHEVLISLAMAMPAAFPAEGKLLRYVQLWPSVSWQYSVGGMQTSEFESYATDNQGNRLSHLPTAGWSEPIARHDPCRCGSGRKYKDCHGF